MKCPDCDISLTLHLGEGRLTCHYCGYTRKAPDVCPNCGSRRIRHFGTGTERVAAEAQLAFPGARIARMDSDTTVRKGSHEAILGAFAAGETDILVGTQMIAKGLDIPGVTLVGVITADTTLNLPDFRAAERTFQLVTQVAGRAGRGEKGGEVIVQTYAPEHYALSEACLHNYDGFYRTELAVRRQLDFPPFTTLLNVLISGSAAAETGRTAEQVGRLLSREICVADPSAEVLGPSPAALPRLRGRTRWQVLIKTHQRAAVVATAKRTLWALSGAGLPGDVRVSLDVDPVSML
jgi:primosomal protein N' (replication factor Y)